MQKKKKKKIIMINIPTRQKPIKLADIFTYLEQYRFDFFLARQKQKFNNTLKERKEAFHFFFLLIIGSERYFEMTK